jgi:hypothetical protein
VYVSALVGLISVEVGARKVKRVVDVAEKGRWGRKEVTDVFVDIRG